MASAPTVIAPVRSAAIVAGLAALCAAALILYVLGSAPVAAGFLAAGLVAGGTVIAARLVRPAGGARAREDDAPRYDLALARDLAGASDAALAVTDRTGRMVCANDAFQALFGGYPAPPGLPLDGAGVEALGKAGRAAWRDGRGVVEGLRAGPHLLSATVVRAGETGDMLVWRFDPDRAASGPDAVARLLSGPGGERLGRAGVMAALLSPDGRVRAFNRVLAHRATGRADGEVEGRDLARYLATDERGRIRFEREGGDADPLRVLELPVFDGEDAPLLVALLDEEGGSAPAAAAGPSEHVRNLVALLPLGLALVDRDGRFVQMNDAFLRAAGVRPGSEPLYPGDLVVREDKAAVADAIRRFAHGATHSADMAVRLAHAPDEPVALTIAGARGLGDAAVLLSLKDNSEESRLKREVAQATKMQAVGQLAGGVAHDFNNILTAILGYCDLMLMRHSPGDSDYDDIQQIRANSNRAAALTRQLLAFSRQQTLRPQILQLPDIVSEVTNLLKRLMGELVAMEVHHGRNLGLVRADPGQLEQVVVNLAVNARDAILVKHPRGGGKLTIATRAVPAAEVRRLGNDVLPIADYTALEVSDNGSGIPPENIGKIFEPFFSTKETGKGTGLGLSTVYGIVKQSGGYIFADSEPGRGATFTIYLPVHAAAGQVRPAEPRRADKPAELWGSGTILLVEDEDMVRAVAERALTRQGYSVLTAENGEAALELLERSGRPDLLVSDVVMPTMDGPTMVRRVRERYPDLPIIFMSGYAEEQLRRSIDLPNVAFLAKPFSVQQLAEATRTALAGR